MYKEYKINQCKVTTNEFLSKEACEYILSKSIDIRKTYNKNESFHIYDSSSLYYGVKDKFDDIIGSLTYKEDVINYINKTTIGD